MPGAYKHARGQRGTLLSIRRPRGACLTLLKRKPNMAAAPDFTKYLTKLNIEFPQMAVVDVPALVAANKHPWYNQTLCQVNESVVRLGVLQGEYHWHQHDNDDEFFYVVSGRFLIDLEDRTVDLGPGQGFVVTKGVQHRPRAPEKTVVLMVENKGIVPTGDA
jgi:mannose-6-phosphate isomerase-like protein (cupin superfamily)